MIIVLFGQPASGKTTLAEKVQRELFIKENASYPIIDGDEIREILIVSAVYPYNEARMYLESVYENVAWVFLNYYGERGREDFHVKDFELPIPKNNLLPINTSKDDIEFATQKICSFYWKISDLTRRS